MRKAKVFTSSYACPRLKLTSYTAANDLIASLKAELATQTSLVQEARRLKRDLARRNDELAVAEKRIKELESTVSGVQSENRTLSAKLAATRNANATVQSSDARTQMKDSKGQGSVRTIMVGSAEAAQAAQAASLKEDLYGDLTGLILRGVKKDVDTDVYDCLQTGRNGSESKANPSERH